MKKKILWIVLLIVLVIAIVIGIIIAKPKEKIETSSANTTFSKTAVETNNEDKKDDTSAKEYEKIELSDGILYALNGEEVQSDIVIGDNYFDTTISDMYLNPEDYMNQNIEIEGMYLSNDPYKFVGRYSTSNLCPYCPQGYSYLEYVLDGALDREFTDTEEWIKVIGTLQKGNDETSNYEDYYYLKVLNLEVMNERGKETVEN